MLVHQLILRGEDKRICFHGDNPISFARLRLEVDKFRTYLYSAGVRPGENIGLLARNSPAFVYAYMAIISLGAVVVPINYQLTAGEVAYIVKDAQMKNLIVAKPVELAGPLNELRYSCEVEQHIIEHIDVFTLHEVESAPCLDESIQEEQPCTIIYTSGTTGSPKGAVLTHKNLVSDATSFSHAMPVYATDNILCILPLYHCLAWTCIILCGLLHNASVTVLDTLVPKEVITAIKRFGVTVMYGVPSVYMLLMRNAEREDLQGLRLLMSGGASLPQKIAEDFHDKFSISITEGYGLSEAAPVVATNPQHLSKHLSIGKAIPGVEVRIVSPEGEELPAGKVGELIVRGPNVMLGYYNLPEATAQALRGGWLHTGDLAFQDEDGYLFIVDRLKDMIITHGENIYPREIEEILYSFPGVRECAVVGVSDGLRGEVACAYIVMAEQHSMDIKAIKGYLRDRLAAYKIPRTFIQLDALPKNQSGKIMKRLLKSKETTSYG